MRTITFELCAETVEACIAAQSGGAHRIELCSALTLGGISPSHALTRAALKAVSLPIHVLVRPHPYGFVYTASDLAVMAEDILHLKHLGAAGIVLGALHSDGTVNIEETRNLVQLAHPLEVTFHRAFDETPSLTQALEDVIAAGCSRILTAGGQPDVEAGSNILADLVTQARGRIAIAAGGGLRRENAAEFAYRTRVQHFHGSLLPHPEDTVHPAHIRATIEALQSGSTSLVEAV